MWRIGQSRGKSQASTRPGTDAKLLGAIHLVDQSGQAAVKTRLAHAHTVLGSRRGWAESHRERHDLIADAGRSLGLSWALGRC
jgi:hypothetical protein